MKRTIIAVALIMALVWACVPPGPPRKYLIGDSIARELDPSGFSLVDASGSRDFDSPGGHSNLSQLQAIKAMVPKMTKGSVLTLISGSNDVTNSPGSYGYRILTMLAAIPAHVCVVWVNVWRPAYEARVREWNRLLNIFVPARKCSVVADWYGAVRTFPGLVGSDQLHLTTKGKQTMKGMIVMLSTSLGAP